MTADVEVTLARFVMFVALVCVIMWMGVGR